MKNISNNKLNNLELLFLYFMYRGYNKEDIAQYISIDEYNTELIYGLVMKKLGAISPVQAVQEAFKQGKIVRGRMFLP